jgi:hypothetical protein
VRLGTSRKGLVSPGVGRAWGRPGGRASVRVYQPATDRGDSPTAGRLRPWRIADQRAAAPGGSSGGGGVVLGAGPDCYPAVTSSVWCPPPVATVTSTPRLVWRTW